MRMWPSHKNNLMTYTMKKGNLQTLGGLALPVMVFLVFLILKLTDCIDWSWWWVVSPLWIFVLILMALTALYIIVFAIRLNRRN